MSGHSKWASIKHKKAITDAKKSKAFSKIASLISIAAKKGGDPAMNPNLRLMIEKGKAAGMTKENIERAIKRGTGELGGAALEEMVYEIYGPSGVGIILEAVTDNKNRTVGEIRAILNKHNGKMAETGSVAYQFNKKGVVAISSEGNLEEIELAAIDAGAMDIQESDGQVIVYTDPSQLDAVKQKLEASGIIIENAEISLEPQTTVPVDPNKSDQVIKLLELLDDFEDVTSVSTNAEL